MEKEMNLIFKMVQGQIGYTFKNPDLLKQAFTRRSYTEENGGENNEILEFIGDKALDFAVVKLLIGRYGKMKNGDPVDGSKNIYLRMQPNVCREANEFSCDYSESELTELKSRIVRKKNLAQRIEEMGFSDGLIMGKSDIKNNVLSGMSVKEDLFEAIVGAVALDSGWDSPIIQSVVEAMLVLDDFIESDRDDNYVRLIQEWEAEKNGVIPLFWFKEQSYTSTWYLPFDGISQNFPADYDFSRLKYHCELKLLNDLPIFRSFGASKSEARMNVCELAYHYLEENHLLFSIRDEIDAPDKEKAINQLEILARRGYFSIPTYDFEKTYDRNGNPIWECTCRIEEYDEIYSAVASSKKEAKKLAALKMLCCVIEEDD